MRALQAILLSTCLAAPAFGCAITVTEPLKYAFKTAPIAFEGTLQSIHPDGSLHFKVHRQWKGAKVDEYVVTNVPSNCAYTGARTGETYVVVPGPNNMIDGGSHIQPSSSAEEMIAILDSRAGWWRCPLSSFTARAIVRAAVR